MKLEVEANVSQAGSAARQSHASVIGARTPRQRPFTPYTVQAANDVTALVDLVPEDAPADAGDGRTAGSAGHPSMVTRLGRELHWNFFAAEPAPDKDAFTLAQDWTQYAQALGIRTPLRAAAVLFGLYIAMYLAVAGIFHALASPDAAAVAGKSFASLSVAAVAGLRPGHGNDVAGLGPSPIDSSRECSGSAAIDSECIFN